MAMLGQPGGPAHTYTFYPPGLAPVDWYYTYEVFQVMSNELSNTKRVVCPADDRPARTNFMGGLDVTTGIGDFNSNLAVSYFYGKDANEWNPRMLLAGDRGVAVSQFMNNAGYGISPDGGTSGAVVSIGTNFFAGAIEPQWTLALHQGIGNYFTNGTGNQGMGNLVFADGSAQSLTSTGLREAAMNSGDNSEPSGPEDNCLIFP
jgi:hypothetical protein